VTVIELATFLAAPFGGTLLAESGARVIKVEPLEGDPFRRVGLEAVHLLHGKESIALDLKSPGGSEVFRRLVSMADVVLHNFRPGVPERLGLDYLSLININPNLVYVYAASYGSSGPQSHRPAFHSTPHALCGGAILQAGEGNPPVDDSYSDPCSGLAVAAAIAMGLFARSRMGAGQYVETSMLTSAAYVHSDQLVDYAERPSRLAVDGSQQGFRALYRLYQCRDSWLFLAADHNWDELKAALSGDSRLAAPEFATDAQRKCNDQALALVLSDLFAARHARAWCEQLSRSGVPAVMADSATFEEFLLHAGMVTPEGHPIFGEYFRVRPKIRYSDRDQPRRPACTLGENSLSILSELGYSPTRVNELLETGAVGAGS